MSAASASQSRVADATSVSSTVCSSKVERLITLSTIGRGGHRLVDALGLGDVAGRADHAARPAVGAAHRDAGLPRPAPVAGAVAIAQLHREARRVALEMLRQGVFEQRLVVGMDAVGPVLRRAHLLRRDPENLIEAGRVIDGVVVDIPVVEILVDGLERQRIALGVRKALILPWLGQRSGFRPGLILRFPALHRSGCRDLWPGLVLGLRGSTRHARNRHPKSPNRVIVAAACIVGVSRLPGFVSSVSCGRISP